MGGKSIGGMGKGGGGEAKSGRKEYRRIKWSGGE